MIENTTKERTMIDQAMWDSEKRDSPYSTVANVEDEFCEECQSDHCDCA
jgi:hypothetical protein